MKMPRHGKVYGSAPIWGTIFTVVTAATGASVFLARHSNVRRTDVKDQIGKTAGAIYELLKSQGPVTVTQVPKLIDEKQPITYQALGWLAREDKIEYNTEKTKVIVSLKEAG
ncbi:MAG: winged helix-turn-helix domain-containing protein [Chitinivibrionales bacterium]